jgi:DNA invertase Pin-like site-specific DNA recombinase
VSILSVKTGGNKMGKVIGYCRISTKGQIDNSSLEQQEKEILNRYPHAVIEAEQYSGAKADRPIFNRVVGSLEKGDLLVVTKLDRFCRSTTEGLNYIEQLRKKGVNIHILNMGLIEDNAMGKLIITNLLAFAEFERSMIIERTQTGKAIAKTKAGFKEGRPKSYTAKQLDHALGMLSINGGKHSYNEVAEITGISKSTLIREVRNRKAD